MSAFSDSSFSTGGFSDAAFDFGSGPAPSPAPVGGHFLPDRARYRKSPPGNMRFVYDKIREAEIDTPELLEIIEPYVAAPKPYLPPILEIDYQALAANEEAFNKFAAKLEAINENLRLAQAKKQAEDDELLMVSVFASLIH